MLEMFGVPATTEAVYRVMLDKPTADLDELAAHVGLSAEAARAELKVLAELMLVNVGPGGGPFFAIPPEQALEVLLAAEEARISECQRRVGRAREDLGELVEAFVASRSLRDSARVRRADRRPCGRHVPAVPACSFGLAQGLLHASRRRRAPRGDRALRPARQRAAESRHPAAAIVSDTSLESRHWRDHLTGQARPRCAGPFHPAPPQRLVIVDETVAIVSRAQAPGALVMKDPDLVAPITALFDAVWHASAPVLGRTDPSGGR